MHDQFCDVVSDPDYNLVVNATSRPHSICVTATCQQKVLSGTRKSRSQNNVFHTPHNVMKLCLKYIFIRGTKNFTLGFKETAKILKNFQNKLN